MEDNFTKLLEFLWNNSDRSVSSSELSKILDVSTRQVRKYINHLNNLFGDPLVFSSAKGYKINSKTYINYRENNSRQQIEKPKTRQNFIIQKLITEKDGIDIFDISEEIFISESTVENDIKAIKNTISNYDVKITKNKNIIILDGSEKNKRKLMSSLITSDSYDNFILRDEIKFLTYHYHYGNFRKDLLDIFGKHNIFVNDYTINNTALHLIITIDRIRSLCILEDDNNPENFKGTPQYEVAVDIIKYIEKSYHVSINDSELYNLILLISNHTSLVDYSLLNESNVITYIDPKYVEIARELIRSMEECYLLEPFTEDFICKFSLHVKNLMSRIENNYFTKNPLAAKIKSTYPLIYDMSVFIAQKFKDKYDVVLNEDEIAFISFHIGSYFENNLQSKKISILFLYADYYSSHIKTLERLSKTFDEKATIKYAISVNDFKPEMIHADLVITTVDIPLSFSSIVINPFLTDKDILKIEKKINSMLLEKNTSNLKKNILDLFNQHLFFPTLQFNNKTDIINFMCENTINYNFANPSFTQDVFSREKMSSTVFQNVAVPHALGNNTNKSFISVSLFPNGVKWDNNNVQLVLLLGFDRNTRDIFSQIFDGLIEIVSDPKCLSELIQSTCYEDFVGKLVDFMDNLHEI